MNLPSQLRLAAEIIEQKKEWEIKMETGWRPGEDMNIVRLVSEGYPIRLAPGAGPVPPEEDGASECHNCGGRGYYRAYLGGHIGEVSMACSCGVNSIAIPIPAQPATDQSTLDDALSYIRHLEEHLRDAQKEVTRLSKDCAEKQPATEEGLVDPPIPPLGDHITERVIVEESASPAPETRRVPLGPEDVPPLSCLRLIDDKGWSIVSSVGPEGLCIGVEDDDGYYFHNLVGKWEILRLGSTKWEPCYKTEL